MIKFFTFISNRGAELFGPKEASEKEQIYK